MTQTKKGEYIQYVAGGITQDGKLAELVVDPETRQTSFLVGRNKEQENSNEIVLKDGRRAKPLSPNNNLIKHGVIKLASTTETYADPELLHLSIKTFIQTYCDLKEDFASLAAVYVMLSWLYDRFDELPYLRLTGSYGTGKTRFLKVVGALCYRSIFASGASSIAPIFHSLNLFGGTLILDEADYRFTDERAEITKLLNNGNAKGFPILRCVKSENGVFNPQAFRVYGPKIVATRGLYEDPALESRFISETARPRKPCSTAPITLPIDFEEQALSLRNQLLNYRFAHFNKPRILPDDLPTCAEDRIKQIYLSLLSVAPNQETRSVIRAYAEQSSQIMTKLQREPERLALEAIVDHMQQAKPLGVSGLALQAGIPARSMGHILRMRLGLETVKRQGCYLVPESNYGKIEALLLRWGLGAEALEAASEKRPPNAGRKEAVIEF